MRKFITALVVLLVVFSCSNGKNGNMIVKGQIKGLKKGTLYLQKMKDTTLVSVDSIQLLGKDNFVLSDDIDSPVMYYLTLDGNTGAKQLLFFGEKGEITINDNLENFGINPEIKGSQNQIVMNKFKEIDDKFKSKRLDYIAKELKARSEKDSVALNELAKEFKKLVRRRFLFTANFAVQHKDAEAAPYIALSELYDANIYLLDTINNSLTDRVKSSDYGKRLQKFVDKIKASETKK